MPERDKPTFGKALKDARRKRNLLQKEVVARLGRRYSDAGTYGRAEQGKRTPDRETVLAILIDGLQIRDVGEINRLLNLAGHEDVRGEELDAQGLSVWAEPTAEPPASLPATGTSRLWIGLFGVLTAAAILAWISSPHVLIVVTTSAFYASLFVISIYLESAFDTSVTRREPTALGVFAIVFLSSVAGLLLDEALVGLGNALALPLAGAVFVGSAVAQFFIARRALPAKTLVPARFQPMTAQSAHLKNSCYFLLLVILFWLPPFHAAVTFERELRAGQLAWVTQMITHDLLMGKGILTLSVRVQLFLLLAILALSLYMGSRLLDRLRPHDRLNRYTQLFYLRAIVYFTLCLICIGWYAYSTSSLL